MAVELDEARLVLNKHVMACEDHLGVATNHNDEMNNSHLSIAQ